MTPAARVQAAIEILDLVIAAATGGGAPADRIITDWFRSRRFAGSKDRRAVRELVYKAIRLCGEVPPSGRAAMLALAEAEPDLTALFDGSTHGPQPIGAGETRAATGIAPRWLVDALAESGLRADEQQALLARAPVDLRVNRLKATREALLSELPAPAVATMAPDGLRLLSPARVEEWDAYRDGRLEVQDSGSQLACLAVGARPGERIIDLCAGAGGKTLALAAAMANTGGLLACDTDRTRLRRLPDRAERAGATMIASRLLDPGRELEMLADCARTADAVLVDAPCSGTGTWRRNPESRWRVTPAAIAAHARLQARLLDIAAALVRPGGRLVYVVCSLLDEEGANQAAAFMERHPAWASQLPELPAGRAVGAGIRLTPYHDDADGFFIARLVAP